jgi:hypothetical protein
LLIDVGADADDTDVVGMVEVVAEIELVHVERDDEFGKAGGHARCADEGYCKVWSVSWSSVLFCCLSSFWDCACAAGTDVQEDLLGS